MPADLPLFQEATRRGIQIAPEIELGFAVARAPIIAVTGTNGKSTTVELLGAIGRNAGRKTEVLGNIGTALSERADTVPEGGLLIVEVSSFQLETCTLFRPHVGVILNVTPDHLDRHGSLERYAEIKARMFASQTAEDFRVQPLGDPRLTRLLQPMRSRPLWFGFADPTGDGVWESEGVLRFRLGTREGTILGRDEALLQGPHNTENLCAAAGAALAAGVPERAIAKTFREFRGLPHRLALVAELAGVRYVNDSKATNVDALRRALESFEGPIVLIAGGRDKDGDFASIAPLVRERVRHAVYLGEATSKLEQAWPQVPSSRAKTLEDAVLLARAQAVAGRGGPSLPGLRELRHVPKLRGARREIRGRGPRAQAVAGQGEAMSFAIARSRRPDLSLLLPVAALVALGVVMVYSSSAFLGAERFQSEYFFLKRHAFRLGIGVIVLLLAARIDYHIYMRLAPWALGASMLLLVTLLAVGGVGIRGANRWLSLATINVQPTEIARIACVAYLARLLDRKGERMASFRDGVLPACGVLGILSILILLQPNLGSTIALLATGFVMLHLSGARFRHLGLLALIGILVAWVQVLRHPYMMDRVVAWLSLWGSGSFDVLGKNWQLSQSIIALGSGGIFGTGPGHGLQKVFFLPDPHTDFIFAVIGEELGLIGTGAVLLAYLVLFLRGLKIAGSAPDRFGYLLAAGLTVNLSVYVAMNIAVVTGVIPTTGLPLPFLSYGGSALVVNLGVTGVLLNISSQMETGIRTTSVVGKAAVRRAGGR